MSTILVTTAESRTGDYIIQNLISEESPCKKHVNQVTAIYPVSLTSQIIESLGAELVNVDVDNLSVNDIAHLLKKHPVDTIVLIPPAAKEKTEVAKHFLQAIVTNFQEEGSKSILKNVVVVSTLGVDEGARGEIAKFASIEAFGKEQLAGTGVNICVVRTAMYMQNLLVYARQIYLHKFLGIPVPGNARIPLIDARDAGAAVAIIASILDDKKQLQVNFRNKTFTVAAPEALSAQAITKMMKQVPELGKELWKGSEGFKEITRKEAEQYLGTIPEIDRSEAMLFQDIFETICEGKLNDPGNDLVDIFKTQNLQIRTFKEFLEEYKLDFLQASAHAVEE
ncbi:hypothetical protein BJ742DRAFT_896773 [Cladochytrium replicatum]|nr:hypothetical protein BJ742DRAFT_896773 [Cladochytrium replicatum]